MQQPPSSQPRPGLHDPFVLDYYPHCLKHCHCCVLFTFLLQIEPRGNLSFYTSVSAGISNISSFLIPHYLCLQTQENNCCLSYRHWPAGASSWRFSPQIPTCGPPCNTNSKFKWMCSFYIIYIHDINAYILCIYYSNNIYHQLAVALFSWCQYTR